MSYVGYKQGDRLQAQLDGPITGFNTTIDLKTGQGVQFAGISPSAPMFLTLEEISVSIYGVVSVVKYEVVKATGVSGDTLTVVRAQLGTTAQSFSADDYISNYLNAEVIIDIQNEVTRLNSDKLNISDYQNGSKIYDASSTGSDAYAITLSPAPGSYSASMCFRFKADVANTGAATLNVNGLGAKTIKKMHDQDLVSGDIEAGQVVTVSYDGTNFQMDSQVALLATVNIADILLALNETAGEALTAGQPVRFGVSVDGLSEVPNTGGTTSSSQWGIKYDNTNYYQGQTFAVTGTSKTLQSITARLVANGSPTGNLTCKVYSGAGTGLLATSTNTIAENGISGGSGSDHTFNFNNESLPAGTYYIEISSDRGNSTTNFVMWAGSASNPYSGGESYRVNSSGTWSSVSGSDKNFTVVTGIRETTTKIYRTDASISQLTKFIGFAYETVAADEAVRVNFAPIDTNQSGLTGGSTYYLSNTKGAISSSPGTVSVAVGIAVKSTVIMRYV